MMRFNKKGEWNIPFCKKPNRFSPAYITKICNQVEQISHIIKRSNWSFINADFKSVLSFANENDLIYCDPPYYGRYVDYYNGWTEDDEIALFNALSNTRAKFILSTWHHNDFRENEMLKNLWSKFNVITKEHFYHSGGKIENRHSMIEALVFNFELSAHSRVLQKDLQMVILGTGDEYFENFFKDLENKYPDKIKTILAFDQGLARRIYAGCDLFLMPSASEPCGLSQMIASRYGTIPMVRVTGGLKDSIKDFSLECGNGYTFEGMEPNSLKEMVFRALDDYKNDDWNNKIKKVMQVDFSWDKSAKVYLDLYKKILM